MWSIDVAHLAAHDTRSWSEIWINIYELINKPAWFESKFTPYMMLNRLTFF